MDEDQKETKTQEWKEARKNLRVSSIQAIEKAVVVFCGKAMKERSKVQLNFELALPLACGNAALTGAQASGYSGASPTLNTTIGSSRSVYGSEVSFKVKSRFSLAEEECRSSGVLGAHSAPCFHTNRRRLLCKTSSNPGPQPPYGTRWRKTTYSLHSYRTFQYTLTRYYRFVISRGPHSLD